MLQQSRARTEMWMRWTPPVQEIRFGQTSFVHEGETGTYPTHDLAHLFVAAAGPLEWNPLAGGRRTVMLSEYNAVMIEVLMTKIVQTVHDRHIFQPSLISSTLRHMRWFVEHHYAPFPMEAELAYTRFCGRIDAEALVRLSPLFFDLRLAEQRDKAFMTRDWELRFTSGDMPQASGASAECQQMLREQMGRIMRSANRPAKFAELSGESVPAP